ncbi:hypothetical protein [Providencia stuartii]|uniref:hypothetical protein n=1 Tax=Providencia stuartii TaxID=588 RepID=UPI0009770B0E|nr:hypothetical protein [Providencia stuartii]MDK7736379.1 hypothetical protein [Providencia stuartii]MTB80543.1 hypothetical protein [Providencia stuartii]OMH52539.1 hypothetical protein BTZ17_00025 [Providencia stuartii]WRV50273.1 hypothetical protein VQ573_11195 [Providencia stuartii]HEM8343908.1 hypothetical protein [Providencia stuartii]
MKEKIKNHLLDDALKELSCSGIYWNGSISRMHRGYLLELLNEHGFTVKMSEVLPHWEHVFYTSKYSYNEVLKIAKDRAKNSGF